MSMSLLHSVSRRAAKRLHCFIPTDLVSVLSNMESLGMLSQSSLPDFETAICNTIDKFNIHDVAQTLSVMQRVKWQNKLALDKIGDRAVILLQELQSNTDSNVHPRTVIRTFVQSGLLWYKHPQLHDMILQYLKERRDVLNQDEREWIVSVALLRLEYSHEEVAEFEVNSFEVVRLDMNMKAQFKKKLNAPSTSRSGVGTRRQEATSQKGALQTDDDYDENDYNRFLSDEARQALNALYESCRDGTPAQSDKRFIDVYEKYHTEFHSNALARFLLCCLRSKLHKSPIFFKACQEMANGKRVMKVSPSNFAVVMHAFSIGGITPGTHETTWEHMMTSLNYHKSKMNESTFLTVLFAGNALHLRDQRFFDALKDTLIDETRDLLTSFRTLGIVSSLIVKLRMPLSHLRPMLLYIIECVKKLDELPENTTVKDASHMFQALTVAGIWDKELCDIVAPLLEKNWNELEPVQIGVFLKYLNAGRITHRPIQDVAMRGALKTYPSTPIRLRLSIAMHLTRLGQGEAYCELMDDDWEELVCGEWHRTSSVVNQLLFLLSVSPSPVPREVRGKPTLEYLIEFLRERVSNMPLNHVGLAFKLLTKLGAMKEEQVEWLRECISQTAAMNSQKRVGNVRVIDVEYLLYAAGGTQLIRSKQVQENLAVVISKIPLATFQKKLAGRLANLKAQL